MSNQALVNDVLALIGVIPEGVVAPAEQGNLTLRVATELVDEWADDGIVLSWEPSPTLDGDCSLIGTELNALKYATAIRLCPIFGREPSQALAVLAASSVGRLIRQQLNRSMEASDAILPGSEVGNSTYNITTGGF